MWYGREMGHIFSTSDVHVSFQSCHCISSDCMYNLLCGKGRKSKFGVLPEGEACRVPPDSTACLPLSTAGLKERLRTSKGWLPAPFVSFSPPFGHLSPHSLSPDSSKAPRARPYIQKSRAGTEIRVCCCEVSACSLTSGPLSMLSYLSAPCL